MNTHDSQGDILSLLNLWGPRVLVGLSILLLVYFTDRTDRFKGTFDETFLSRDNLLLSRGPFAKKEYYERGMLDYKPKELFTSEKKKAEAAAKTVPPTAEEGLPVPLEPEVLEATAPIAKPTS